MAMRYRISRVPYNAPEFTDAGSTIYDTFENRFMCELYSPSYAFDQLQAMRCCAKLMNQEQLLYEMELKVYFRKVKKSVKHSKQS